MTTTDLTIHQPQGQVVRFDQSQRDLIRKLYAPGVNEMEFAAFLEICQRQGLDPFARQIYAIPRSGKMTIQVSIDGLRLIAADTGEYRGQVGPEWCGEDGLWRDVWLSKEPPAAARVGVMREGFDTPVYGIARWASFAQPESKTWKGMPDVMLAKCAEAQALRKAFPQRLASLFVPEEDIAVQYVVDTENQRNTDRPAPRAIQQPRAKSAPKPRPQQEEKPFGAEDEEPPIEGEVTAVYGNPAPKATGEAPWGTFWNALTKATEGTSIQEIGAALGIEPSIKALQGWYSESGASLELVDFVMDTLAAAKGQ